MTHEISHHVTLMERLNIIRIVKQSGFDYALRLYPEYVDFLYYLKEQDLDEVEREITSEGDPHLQEL